MNNACLVTQSFSQMEGLHFGKTFGFVACLKAIRIILTFTAFKGFKLYRMDEENAFLNGDI
jgi:hypothetical protein